MDGRSGGDSTGDRMLKNGTGWLSLDEFREESKASIQIKDIVKAQLFSMKYIHKVI